MEHCSQWTKLTKQNARWDRAFGHLINLTHFKQMELGIHASNV